MSFHIVSISLTFFPIRWNHEKRYCLFQLCVIFCWTFDLIFGHKRLHRFFVAQVGGRRTWKHVRLIRTTSEVFLLGQLLSFDFRALKLIFRPSSCAHDFMSETMEKIWTLKWDIWHKLIYLLAEMTIEIRHFWFKRLVPTRLDLWPFWLPFEFPSNHIFQHEVATQVATVWWQRHEIRGH